MPGGDPGRGAEGDTTLPPVASIQSGPTSLGLALAPRMLALCTERMSTGQSVWS